MNINDLIGRLQSQREQHGYDCKVVIEHEERDYDFIVCGSTGRITLSVDTEIEIEEEDEDGLVCSAEDDAATDAADAEASKVAKFAQRWTNARNPETGGS